MYDIIIKELLSARNKRGIKAYKKSKRSVLYSHFTTNLSAIPASKYGTNYSRMVQVKFVEDSL